MKQLKVSNNVIRRLPRYLRKLDELKTAGVDRISSGELGRQMSLTSSQIRQDFSCFGEFGQQGYGYNVKYLYDEIGKILGLDKTYNMIILGAGNLGQALANYVRFEKRGFRVIGMFDVNPQLIGKKIRGIEIRMLDELPEFLEQNDIQIATLTLPKAAAEEVAIKLVESGIKAIWNFAHTDLNLPDDVVVENVHLSESLMQLSYNITKYQREKNTK